MIQYYIRFKEVKHAKYLGVTIDHHLSWNKYINYITSKANNCNVKCFLQCRNLSQFPMQSLVRSYTSYPGTRLHCVGSSYTKEYIKN